MQLSGFGARLVTAMALVVMVSGAAAWLVARVVGPGIFRSYMTRAEHEPGSMADHAVQAFMSAGTLTLAVALGVSVATSLAIGAVMSRRVGKSLRNMARVAGQVATGRFSVRVRSPRVGSEFDELAAAINAMAERLGENESMRRQLTADVTHELRTPVATISAYLDAIDDGVEQLGPETIEVLRAQASRLTRLVEDLSAVARAESGTTVLDLTPVHPGELVELAAHAARAGFSARSVRLTTAVQQRLGTIAVDRDRMGQVLGNLLDNALRHTPAGGEVRLTAERHGTGVRFMVVDTGEGIAAEHLPHLFERFYRADAARDRGHGGSGIGLAIVRALVMAHGGAISAHSEGPGRGATFVVDLPPTGATRAWPTINRLRPPT
ncbi:sensor histidine kinase [Myceligenerans crystallogenes]|uniref:histidine kinase n=1 Tax=Myceligenerans crystallogenes TaxID=316335 RepID=A0ABN2ND92_9MICO